MNSIHRAFPDVWPSDVMGKENGRGHYWHRRRHQLTRKGRAGEKSNAPFADIGLAPEEMNYQHQKQENHVFVRDSIEKTKISQKNEDLDADKSTEKNRMTEHSRYKKEDDRNVINEAIYDSQIMSHVHSSYDKDQEHIGITFQNHKTLCNSALIDYISQRLSIHDDEDEDANNVCQSLKNEEESKQRRNWQRGSTGFFHISESNTQSQILEAKSQPVHENYLISKDTKMQQRQSHQQPTLIPPISRALHAVHLVSQIDLYTNTLCLDLCRVETIIPLRRTNRMREVTKDLQTPSNIVKNDNHFHPPKKLSLSQLSNFQYGRHADDGPLFGIYKKVLSINILQLETLTQQKFHQVTSTFNTAAKLYRRISIYFYNYYATRIHTFFQTHPNCNYYCRLMEIPAICIFPYYSQSCRWFEDGLSEYVVCVGGKSICCVKERTNQLHFELAVSIPVQPSYATSSKEYTMGPSEKTESPSIHLREALQNWKVQNGILPYPAAKVGTLMEEAPQDEPPAKRHRKMGYTELVRD
jgi:hypothetical protein